nr:GntR family transcriptional regulator [Bifidobacterium catenulatum]
MKLIISSVSGEPIYEQIKNQIRSAIMSGELMAGEALPSLRKLAIEAKAADISLLDLLGMFEKAYREQS